MRRVLVLFSVLVILVVGIVAWQIPKTTGQSTRSALLSVPSCPPGFIRVPGNASYKTTDFCVMKYDAKCALRSDLVHGIEPQTGSPCFVGNGTYKNDGRGCACQGDRQVVSVASGAPITYLPEDDGSTTSAKSYCAQNGWHLLTNAEWMSIARNVELVPQNWCNADGTGCGATPGTSGKILANGHNDQTPNRALTAGSDGEPCFGTGKNGTGTCGDPGSQKRTLTLSNGVIIWDFAGNVWQWVDAQIARRDQPQSMTNTLADHGWKWSEFAPGAKATVITGNGNEATLGYDAFRPSNSTWNSNQGVGRIYHYSRIGDTDHTLYTFIRGGNWRHGYDSGAFTIHLSPQANKRHIDDVGFRCAMSL